MSCGCCVSCLSLCILTWGEWEREVQGIDPFACNSSFFHVTRMTDLSNFQSPEAYGFALLFSPLFHFVPEKCTHQILCESLLIRFRVALVLLLCCSRTISAILHSSLFAIFSYMLCSIYYVDEFPKALHISFHSVREVTLRLLNHLRLKKRSILTLSYFFKSPGGNFSPEMSILCCT